MDLLIFPEALLLTCLLASLVMGIWFIEFTSDPKTPRHYFGVLFLATAGLGLILYGGGLYSGALAVSVGTF